MEIETNNNNKIIITQQWCDNNHELLSDFMTEYYPIQAKRIKLDHPNYYFEVYDSELRIRWPESKGLYSTLIFKQKPWQTDFIQFLLDYKINEIINK
jgi:hypothetical protein